MINITKHQYNKLITEIPGIGLYRFRMEQLQAVNLYSDLPYNHKLIGHIEKEYEITDQKQKELLASLIDPVVIEYDRNSCKGYDKIVKKMDLMIPPPELNEVWVNRQKKHEFNPLHVHTGLYSFVLWYDIPYTSEEEKNASPLKVSNQGHINTSGSFQYLPTDKNNLPVTLFVDKTWNGTLAVFPADTQHQVYPFYSTDKERITISGNYSWNYLSQQ
jgi:hypothetical protein